MTEEKYERYRYIKKIHSRKDGKFVLVEQDRSRKPNSRLTIIELNGDLVGEERYNLSYLLD